MNKINSILEIAQEQAMSIEEAQQPVAANDTSPQGPTLVSNLTMDEVSLGSMTNDEWLKVKPFGLLIGSSNQLITDGIIVQMNFTQNTACFSIKAGNPAIYKKTYGGGICVGGGDWEDTVRQIMVIDPKARPYRSADIIMTVLEDNDDAKTDMILGHSLSTTNWGSYFKFYNECKEKNLIDKNIRVKVSHMLKSNKAGNEWGILSFELLES